jgi:hypothetical protein
MAFTFTNYAAIQPQESPFSDIIGKILGGYSDMTKAQYLKPTLAEELKKAKLFNEYYGPNMESEIGLRKAQTGESGARTGLIGEQTKGARLENQYLPEKMKAQIAEAQAGAQKERLLQMIREQMLGGGLGSMQGGGEGNPQGNSPMGMFGGQGMPAPQMSQNAPMQQPQQEQANPTGSGMDYAKAATAMQLLGLGKPHVVEANGRYIAITPFGNIDTGVSGLSARDTQLAKEDAKKISALENTVLTGAQKQETFNELNKDLGSPEFEVLRRHPELGRHELGWYDKFGTKEQQEMIGRMKTHMGNIIKDSSRDFAGQFRIGEQALLNDMKPNVSDSLGTMKGKAEALTYMNQLMTKRAEKEADLMRNYNMSALQARLAADKSIKPKEIKKEIKTILHPASTKKSNFSQDDLDFTAKKHGLTVDEVRQKLEAR